MRRNSHLSSKSPVGGTARWCHKAWWHQPLDSKLWKRGRRITRAGKLETKSVKIAKLNPKTKQKLKRNKQKNNPPKQKTYLPFPCFDFHQFEIYAHCLCTSFMLIICIILYQTPINSFSLISLLYQLQEMLLP